MSTFFVACQLGFETALQQELKNFWFEMMDLDGQPTRVSFPEVEVLEGGLEISTEDHLGYQINFFSKLANRVLIRIAKFEARYFDRFEKSFAKVELEKFLDTEKIKNQLSLKIDSRKSRLNNVKSIAEAATSVLLKKNIKVSDEAVQTLFIRLEKDTATVSLDTSGEHLHRRGYAKMRGEAPLRETLAAYMVQELKKHIEFNNKVCVIDPFAGSGTILFEALSSTWPVFEKKYSWLGFKNAPKIFKSETWKKNYRWIKYNSDIECRGFDIDAKAVASLKANADEFKKIFGVETADIQSELLDSSGLYKKIDDTFSNRKIRWVVTNPPYGIRLADEKVKESLESLDGKIDGLILLHPLQWKLKFSKLKNIHTEDFSNQGLELKLSVYKS